MDVSIVIVNYNTCNLLADCLETLYRFTRDVVFEVIVVDNASTDGSESYIRKHYPEVVWINSGENLGFGRANNLGVRQAKGEYLFFLNSDTLLQNNAVGNLLNYARSGKCDDIGVLGCWLLDREGLPNNAFGFFPNVKNEMKYLLGKYPRPDSNMISKEKDVDYITGADMFMRKTLFDRMGGFDSNIFMYYEETDLQYRIAKEGLVRRIIPGPQIVHLEGGSFDDKGLTVKRFMMAPHRYNYYLSKHFSGLSSWYKKCMGWLLRLTLFITTDWSWKDKWRAYLVVFKSK